MTSTNGMTDSSGSFDAPPLGSFAPPPSLAPPLPPQVIPPAAKAKKPLPPPVARGKAAPVAPPVAPPVETPLGAQPVAVPSKSVATSRPVAPSPSQSSPPAAVPQGAVRPKLAATPAVPRIAVAAVEEPLQEAEEIRFSIHDLYRDSPAWLTSLVIHMLVVIILGLIYIAPKKDEILQLVASLAQNGNNTELTNSDIVTDVAPVLEEPPVYIPEGKPVEDPLVTPMSAVPSDQGLLAADPSIQNSAEMVGQLFDGRDAGSKTNLAIKFGATQGTLDALAMSLEWIARNQQKNGSWSLSKPYSKGAPYENINAATAMAMLALQGDGNTHMKGQYQRNVAAGLKVLLRSQADSGSLIGQNIGEHQMMYTHAFCTIALCELYGMSHDSLLKEPCEKAVNFLVKVQSPEGGWRYRPGNESDTSVTGWCVMALQSARAAKIAVPNSTLERVTKFLDSVKADEYAYGYLPNDPPTYSMTAEALLCRQLLGMKRNNPEMPAGIGILLRSDDMTWEDDKSGRSHSVYGWYYATQVMHHYGGKEWEKWNSKLRVVLPANQIKNGPERGSWSPDSDFYGSQAGRLYQTCICSYMLEVYWRHLPLYKEVYDGTVKASE